MLKPFDESVFNSLEMAFTSCTENEKFSSVWKKKEMLFPFTKKVEIIFKGCTKYKKFFSGLWNANGFPIKTGETSSTLNGLVVFNYIYSSCVILFNSFLFLFVGHYILIDISSPCALSSKDKSLFSYMALRVWAFRKLIPRILQKEMTYINKLTWKTCTIVSISVADANTNVFTTKSGIIIPESHIGHIITVNGC